MTGVQTIPITHTDISVADSLYRWPQPTMFLAHVSCANCFLYGTGSLTFTQSVDGTGSIVAQDSIVERGPINFRSLADDLAMDGVHFRAVDGDGSPVVDNGTGLTLYANNEVILWGG